ncbi:MAG: FGGY-family carbohydrate kinase, partial [Chloroflexota bacterium]|nr:FGGY-family carbohydrate kinase [Chloroflexota bacterium]
AANVGSGCVDASRVALTVGTTGAMRVLLAGVPRSVPQGLWAYRLDARSTLLGGSLTEGGSVLRWLMETLNLPPLADVEPQLARLQPDGHGLTVLPFLGGERSPGFATRATGVVAGLRLSTRPEELLQASLEAIAYRFGLRLIHRLLEPHVAAGARVIASGGAITASPYWLQAMADVLQRPVTVCAEPEATSRGVAVLALRALGVWPRLDAVPAALGETYHPDAERGKIYSAALERQAAMYDKLIARDEVLP